MFRTYFKHSDFFEIISSTNVKIHTDLITIPPDFANASFHIVSIPTTMQQVLYLPQKAN